MSPRHGQETSRVRSGSVIGGARVSHQLVRNVAIAGDVAFGGPFNGSAPAPPRGGPVPFTGVFATRAHVRVSPDSDHVAFIGGIGGGAVTGHSGMGFFDLDAGVRVGTHYRRLIEGYLGEDIVWSYAIFDMSAGTTTSPPYLFYFVTDAGIIGHATPRLAIGANLSMYLAVGSNGQFFGQSAGGTGTDARPFFIPGLWVRYTFGGVMAAGE